VKKRDMPVRLATMRYATYFLRERDGNCGEVPWEESFFIIMDKTKKIREANAKRHVAIAIGGAKSTATSTTINDDPQMTITPIKPKKYIFDPRFEVEGVDGISDTGV
jgi:hypothetical protein